MKCQRPAKTCLSRTWMYFPFGLEMKKCLFSQGLIVKNRTMFAMFGECQPTALWPPGQPQSLDFFFFLGPTLTQSPAVSLKVPLPRLVGLCAGHDDTGNGMEARKFVFWTLKWYQCSS